ncbi:MAG: biotin transporter BioY [Chthonomonadales bacterium]
MLDFHLVAPQTLCGAFLSRRVRMGTTRSIPSASAILVVSASLFVTLCARVSFPLPFTPVPVTLQTLGVLTAGIALGARGGFLALCAYLAEGAAGIPVFAGGAAGAHHLIGPTGGYLIAYPLAAGLAGYLAELGWDRRPATAFGAAVLGSVLILISGAAWLALSTASLSRAVMLGVLPFLPGDLLKAAAAAGLLPACWKGMMYVGIAPRSAPPTFRQ